MANVPGTPQFRLGSAQGWSPRGICLGSRRPRGSFLTGSASPRPHKVLPQSCLGLDLTASASALPHSFCLSLGSVWYLIYFLRNFTVSFFIDKCHWPQSKNMCTVHDIKRHKQRRFHSASPRPCLEISLHRLGLELSASALPRLRTLLPCLASASTKLP